MIGTSFLSKIHRDNVIETNIYVKSIWKWITSCYCRAKQSWWLGSTSKILKLQFPHWLMIRACILLKHLYFIYIKSLEFEEIVWCSILALSISRTVNYKYFKIVYSYNEKWSDSNLSLHINRRIFSSWYLKYFILNSNILNVYVW